MAQPLGDSGADEDLVAAAVDDAVQLAMVVTLTRREAAFADLVRAGLRRRLRLAGRQEGLADDAVGLMGSMPAFLDAPAALEHLRGIGLRLGVLTQSSAETADGLRAGWVARRDLVLPDGIPEPDVGGRDLMEVAEGLAKLA